ncbi:MAG: hypothetical protein NZM06_11175 [Chloroherpetonaceae bacterium]|nr:hypothetical protein [Chloroherpetonaceae bacterium]MDW8438174.1 hypothetical protein [Chloroherpetonaceae bacterium]
MGFEQAAKKITEFVGAMTGSNAKLVKLEKTSQDGGGWIGYAEVFEESAFIKSLGLPSRVMDRNLYEVRLNGALEVVAYARKEKLEE